MKHLLFVFNFKEFVNKHRKTEINLCQNCRMPSECEVLNNYAICHCKPVKRHIYIISFCFDYFKIFHLVLKGIKGKNCERRLIEGENLCASILAGMVENVCQTRPIGKFKLNSGAFIL